MQKITDSKHTFGAFIPLPGLGTQQPRPKVLAFVCRNGNTYCTNYKAINGPPTDTCLSLSASHVACGRDCNSAASDGIHTNPSTSITTAPPELTDESATGTTIGLGINVDSGQVAELLADEHFAVDTNKAVSFDKAGHNTSDDGAWHLEGLNALRRSSIPLAAERTAAQRTRGSKEKTSSWRRDSVLSTFIVKCDDKHRDAASSAHLNNSNQAAGHLKILMRPLQPPPSDDAAMSRFKTERALRVSGPLSHFAKYPAEGMALAAATRQLREDSPDVLMDNLSPYTVKPHLGAKRQAMVGENKSENSSRNSQSVGQSKVNHGDLAGIRIEKRQASHKIWRQKRKAKAGAGDPRAIAQIEKERETNRAYEKRLRDKAKSGDMEALGRVKRLSEQRSVRRKEAKRRAEENERDANAADECNDEQNGQSQTATALLKAKASE